MSKAGFIEAWCRGIAKIINGFINAELAAPVFETTMGGVMLTIEKGVKDSKDKSSITENVTENVTDNRHILILRQIKIDDKITIDQLAELFKVTRRTIIRDFEKLKEEGKVIRIGPAKG